MFRLQTLFSSLVQRSRCSSSTGRISTDWRDGVSVVWKRPTMQCASAGSVNQKRQSKLLAPNTNNTNTTVISIAPPTV